MRKATFIRRYRVEGGLFVGWASAHRGLMVG